MKIPKSFLIAGVVTSLSLASVVGLGVASAATNPSTAGNSSLVDKLVAKFNLNKADVQAVFDENRAEHQAQQQQRLADRLTQAVTDGKITADQKAKILAKLADEQTFRDSLKDKTPSERQAAIQANRAALEQWAKDNGIDLSYLHPGRGAGMGHGPMMGDNDGPQ